MQYNLTTLYHYDMSLTGVYKYFHVKLSYMYAGLKTLYLAFYILVNLISIYPRITVIAVNSVLGAHHYYANIMQLG